MEERGPLLYRGRNLSRIVSGGYVESVTYNNGLIYLAEISKQSVKDVSWLLPAAYRKM